MLTPGASRTCTPASRHSDAMAAPIRRAFSGFQDAATAAAVGKAADFSLSDTPKPPPACRTRRSP